MPRHTPRQPKFSTPIFPGRNHRWERCEDCEVDNRLNIVGQPIWMKDKGIHKSHGCETCGGTGHMERGIVGIDPYEIPKRPAKGVRF